MLKRPNVRQFGDIFHKGFVLTCVGVTVFGMLNVGLRVYNYLTVIKPQRLEEAKQAEEQNTLASEEFQDIATPLKA